MNRNAPLIARGMQAIVRISMLSGLESVRRIALEEMDIKHEWAAAPPTHQITALDRLRLKRGPTTASGEVG
jgi:hypothetical protein